MSKTCTQCGQRLPTSEFYFVSRKTGALRGQCKACMAEIKRAQKDPGWKPTCARCGEERERVGPGRRLCAECFDGIYDTEAPRVNGAHRLKLKDCRSCGAKRLREDHEPGTMLCPVCRSVPSHRRKYLKGMFNMNPPEYLALLAYQGERCAICKRRARKTLHIDHQHKDPSIIRGAVCNVCNTLLGLARDSPDVLRQAALYLESPPAQVLLPGRCAHSDANRKREGYNRLTRVSERRAA